MAAALRGVVAFLILGWPGWGILLLSVFLSGSKKQLIGWGIVASIVMLLEFVALESLAGLNSATSGSQSSYSTFGWMGLLFILSLMIYVGNIASKPKNKS